MNMKPIGMTLNELRGVIDQHIGRPITVLFEPLDTFLRDRYKAENRFFLGAITEVLKEQCKLEHDLANAIAQASFIPRSTYTMATVWPTFAKDTAKNIYEKFDLKIDEASIIAKLAEVAPMSISVMSTDDIAPFVWVEKWMELFKLENVSAGIVSSAHVKFTKAYFRVWGYDLDAMGIAVFGGNNAIDHGLMYKPSSQPWTWLLDKMDPAERELIILAEGNMENISQPVEDLSGRFPGATVIGMAFATIPVEKRLMVASKWLERQLTLVDSNGISSERYMENMAVVDPYSDDLSHIFTSHL